MGIDQVFLAGLWTDAAVFQRGVTGENGGGAPVGLTPYPGSSAILYLLMVPEPRL